MSAPADPSPGLPLGWATDLAVARLTGSEVAVHPDHLVVRTPQNPGYHWGNFVLVTDPDACEAAGRWLTVFESAFPDAGHRSVGLVRVPRTDPWESVAMRVETEDVLATTTLPEQLPLDPAYTVRPLTSPTHWTEQVARGTAENDRTGEHDPVGHRHFLQARARDRASLVRAGRAAWFAAYSGEEQVADLGVVLCGKGLVRYQDVATDRAHRRRGLAGHLLGVAARWAADRGARTWVIITEADNPAGRLYRSVGFAPVAAGAQAYRAPVAASR